MTNRVRIFAFRNVALLIATAMAMGMATSHLAVAAESAGAPASAFDVILARFVAMPLQFKIAIGLGVVIPLVFIGFIWVMVRRERASSLAARPVQRQKDHVNNVNRPKKGAWHGADSSRGARDAGERNWDDADELPAITMLDMRWADVDAKVAAGRQSTLIAGVPEAVPATQGIYKTGYNPFFRQPEQEMEVEEVADIETQAELMMSIGDDDAAIGLLTRHIRDTERPSPKAWLLLFEAFGKTGREDQYRNLAKGFRIQYNAEIPPWESLKQGGSRDLESYPAVVEKIQKLWGMPTCKAFIESLIYDDRGGKRQGFMLTAYTEIIFLLELIETSEKITDDELEQRKINLKLVEDKPRF